MEKLNKLKRLEKKDIINKENLVICCIAIILSIFTLLTLSISYYSNNKENIKLNLCFNDKINDMKLSNNSISLDKFMNDNFTIINENGIDRPICNKNVEIEYEISVIDDFYINFGNISENTKVFLNDVQLDFDTSINNSNITNIINISRDKISVIKNSIKNLSALKVVVILFCSLTIWFIILKLFMVILDKIKNDNISILNILYMIFSIFLIYFNTVYLLMYFNRLFAIMPVLILASIFIIYLKNANKNWQNLFLCISVLFGVMFVLIVPPGNVPDEPAHYIRTYADSVFGEKDEVGINLPISIKSLFDKFTHDVHSKDAKFSGMSYLTELTKSPEYSNVSNAPTMYENTKYLSFVPYLPATIVNIIGKIFNLPAIVLFLLARLSNFCVSIILCYYAIKITPKFKKIFLLVGLLPIFFQQAAGVDMDYLTNSVTFMLLALIFKYKYDKVSVCNKDMIILMLTALGLGTCKFGYFPLLFLICIIPNNKFKNKKVAVVFKILIIILPIILSCLFNFGNVSAPNTKSDYYTIEKVLKDPVNSAIICIRTFIARFDLDTFRGLIDGFGWSTKYNPPLILWTIASVYIILLFISDDENKELKIKDRIAMILVFGIIYAILYAIAFTEWTRIELNVINGLQSRYFIPILILFFASISNDLIKLNVKNKYNFYYILLNIVEISAVASLLVGFY